jgi:MSHA pilin protein MshA
VIFRFLMELNMKQQRGFTLIELVMVIVILGILAAVAIPRFVDLRTDAYTAASQGVAGGLNSANAINYGACAARNGVAAAGVCTKVVACADIGGLLQPARVFTVGALPNPTVAGTLYLVANTASTLAGVTCNAVYGNGLAGGVAFTYTATTT